MIGHRIAYRLAEHRALLVGIEYRSSIVLVDRPRTLRSDDCHCRESRTARHRVTTRRLFRGDSARGAVERQKHLDHDSVIVSIMNRVLVIDNDQGMARALSINLRARRYDVRSARIRVYLAHIRRKLE